MTINIIILHKILPNSIHKYIHYIYIYNLIYRDILDYLRKDFFKIKNSIHVRDHINTFKDKIIKSW